MVGLTLVYALSGVLANHRRDWDAEHQKITVNRTFSPISSTPPEAAQAHVIAQLALPAPKTAWWPLEGELELVYAGWSVRAHPDEGVATEHRVQRRGWVKFVHDFHYNRLGPFGTWLADFYAITLAFLALSGAILLRGRAGLMGRGKWLVAAGVLLPLALYFFS